MKMDLGRVLYALPALVWTASRDGRIDFVNRQWAEYTGLGLDEAHGSEWKSIVHPDDLPTLLEWWQSMSEAADLAELEVRLRRFDGVHRRFLVRCSPLFDAEGPVERWCGVGTELETRQALARDELRSELAHVTRVTSLGAMAASIAHEINQPLSGIVTNASTSLRMLAANPPNLEGARETARRTIRDGNRAADVVTRLRALFGKRVSQVEQVDLNEAVREVVAICWSDLLRAGASLKTELAEGLPSVSGDRVQLQQVIMNLLRNSADAVAGIDIASRHVILTTTAGEEGAVRLSVSDSGIGFRTDDPDRVFDAFYSTKSDGMGIGLSVSRTIIESHGGKLWAEANEGPGATFTLSIPTMAGDLAMPFNAERPPSSVLR